jgi:predicted dehydrogenase
MADRVRIGFIGCGGIARGHGKRLLSIPEAELVALCDPSTEAIERFVAHNPEARGLPVYGNHETMLRDAALDAVAIFTPHTLHYPQITDALDRGLHVLTEKPMVCSVAHAHDVIARAKRAGKIVLVVYQRHYQPEYRYAREIVRTGQLGEIQFVDAMLSQNWLRTMVGQWRQDPELSGGGQLNDSGSHLLDVLLWVTGLAVEEVSAYIDNMESPVDINSAMSLRFVGGAQGTIAVLGESPVWWESVTFWGTKGAISYRDGELLHRTYASDSSEPGPLPTPSTPDDNFIGAILRGEAVASPPECGLRVIELTAAAWRSAAAGRPVKVAELGDEAG